jgi:hypothetical protein
LSGLFPWGARKRGEPASAAVAEPARPETVATSKVLPKFLAVLAHQPLPALLDLGPVIGANVAFFGDRLACRIQVEDLFADIEAQARRGTREGIWQAISQRLAPLSPVSFDGILCWDVFDYLDRPTGQGLAARLAGLLRPSGLLYGFFGTTPIDLLHYTRFIVEDQNTFRHRRYQATPVRRNVLLNRDITRMFDPLSVTESVLLKTSTRETLFRKAAG